MLLPEGQPRGWRSEVYRGSFVAGQESRLPYFHEVLDDYLEGRR